MRTTISYPPLRMAAHLKRSRAPDKLACGSACSFAAARRTHTGISGGFTALKFFSCQGRRERLQQAAAPPSSAHFVSYAVAFYIAAYGSACSFAAARGPIQKLPGFSRTAIFQLSRVKCAEPIQEFPAVYRAEILQLSRVKCAELIQKLPSFSWNAIFQLRFFLQLCCSARNLYRNCPALAGLQFFS